MILGTYERFPQSDHRFEILVEPAQAERIAATPWCRGFILQRLGITTARNSQSRPSPKPATRYWLGTFLLVAEPAPERVASFIM